MNRGSAPTKKRAESAPAAVPALFASGVARMTRGFSRAECGEIIALSSGLARHADGFRHSGEVRGASEVCWLPTRTAPLWLVDRINEILTEAATQFAFDISGPLEDLKLMKYRRNNRVAWHVDNGGGATRTRKLTLTALLSAPETFSGGALTVAGYPGELHSDVGDVVIFPSFLAHKVTTVTRGTRHTLVAWAHGTPFR